MTSHEDLLRATYAAFDARDIDAVLTLMSEDVDWPNAWEGGRLVGREAVRDYWMRQWAAIDPRVEPTAFTRLPDGRVEVEVRQIVRGRDGALISDGTVKHVYGFRDGLVSRMDVAEVRPVVVRPGEGHRVGNVEFLARTADTPRFTLGIIEMQPGREIEPHAHVGEDDAFYVLSGEMTLFVAGQTVVAPPGTFVLVPPGVEHGFRNDGSEPARMLNVHAPGGFDRRIGLTD